MTRLAMIRRLRSLGIDYPIITIDEAKREGVPLAVACAVLEQETGGGRNVFGHDPTIFIGAGTVTRAKYERYKKLRGPKGKGGMQGVGPMQLTWYSYQDEADKEGGCWLPRYNVRIGLRVLARHFRKHKDWHAAFKAYNGSETYADQVDARVKKWKRLLAPEAPKPKREPWMDIGPVQKGGKSLLDMSLTHASHGLPRNPQGVTLYPAVDTAWGAGVVMIAPEDCEVAVKDSSANPGEALYLAGASGMDYWFAHGDRDYPLGHKFRKGDFIWKTVDTRLGGGPHGHVGMRGERFLGKGKSFKYGRTGRGPDYTLGAPTVRSQLERLA